MRHRLLKKFVIFMDIMQYQYVWHKADSSVFNLEILISKMHFTLVDQSLKKSIKSWKKLSKTGISSHNIDKELNIESVCEASISFRGNSSIIESSISIVLDRLNK